jgi:putative ABC transport system permease protein
LSAHWRKAPYALVHHRSVLLAVFAAALLAALASWSSPFVTTAAASEALKNKLADLSSFATGLEIRGVHEYVYGDDSAAGIKKSEATRRDAANKLRARLAHVAPPVFTSEIGVQISGPKGDTDVVLMARTDVLAHVKELARVSGPGIWVADITAHDAGLKPGDVVRLGGLQSYSRPSTPRVRIKGIYRALAHSPETNYWGNLYQDIYPQCLDCGVPAPFAFITPDALAGLLAGRNAAWGTIVEFPVDPHSLTLAGARALNRRFDAVRHGLRRSALGQKLGCRRGVIRVGPGAPSLSACNVISSLSAAVILADSNASAVTPAVTLLSDLGTGIALAVAAAAGVFLVRRRRAEAALLYARGESVGTFAARSAVETLVPTIAGGAAGFALAFGLTDVFAPSGSISSGTIWSALAHAAVAVAVAICLLVLTAGAAFLRLYDTGSRGLPWLRWLPWEVVLVGVSVFLFLRIRSGGGVTHTASGAHVPTLAVFIFPLLLVAAVAGIAARGVRLGLRAGSGRTARSRRPAVYLALRRLGAARGVVVLLAVVTAASLGALFYVETLATSLHHTTIEKAYMATGSDAYVIVQDSQQIPRSFPYPATRVQFANQTASIADGTQIDVMLVDPATMAKALHWESDWGPNPTRFLDELARTPSRPLPVIVTSDLAKQHTIVIQGESFRMNTLAVVKAFPFMIEGVPLVITSYRALHDFEGRTKLFESLGVLGTYVWAKGPPAAAGRALTALEPTYPPSTINGYLRAPDVVLATRTFRFMRMIAIGAGVLALLGLLLYLQARQRSQAIASALARRMGFGRVAETFSLCIELTGILLFAGVLGGAVAVAAAEPIVHRIDPLPTYAPSPIFTVPVGEIAIAAVALVAVAIIAGALTSWFAGRTDVSEALRVA